MNGLTQIAPPGPGEVHVWWIALDLVPRDAVDVLAPEERARADRLRRPLDRVRWTAARAALRHILAGYTGSLPEQLRFEQASIETTLLAQIPLPNSSSPVTSSARRGGVRGDRWRKPALAGDSPLRFSLTHAGDRAALAVGWEREVGIDLEAIDGALDLPPLLAVACAPTEIARLESLPAAERVEAFHSLWTLKEAYLKATGAGLSRDPRTIAVELLPNGRAAVADSNSHEAHQRWDLCRLDAGPGWVAALAAAGAEPIVHEFRWPERH